MNTDRSEQLYDDLAEELKLRGARMGAMFGRRALKRDDKVFALLQDDALACSLGAGSADHGAALAVPGAYLFDPSRRGRPFKDWVSIPVEQSEQWQRFAGAAFERVGR
ncbi:MAG: hypothetical protein JWR53_1346 [Glaciihabitans sp.]|nr:hypothetical protein [Glaciihabitans sp.]MDQ1555451.1 hypothetical protein [Actinomycetota bacterium]